MTIEMILWHQLFQRHLDEWSKGSLFLAHHSRHLSCSETGHTEKPGTLSPLHLPSEGTGVALQGARCFPSCSDGRNHSETLAGCIVSCTTASNCSRNWSRSTCLPKVALKAATVLAASYLLR